MGILKTLKAWYPGSETTVNNNGVEETDSFLFDLIKYHSILTSFLKFYSWILRLLQFFGSNYLAGELEVGKLMAYDISIQRVNTIIYKIILVLIFSNTKVQ